MVYVTYLIVLGALVVSTAGCYLALVLRTRWIKWRRGKLPTQTMRTGIIIPLGKPKGDDKPSA